MTENKGSSQPKKNGNNGGKSNSKKNRNVKRTIIKIIGFMIIAFLLFFY
ncbi:penicillin-binding protein 2 [Staphylococcus aureus]|nr:penicillin-binding protein 2 [Staphylococcus aureus]